MKLDDQVATPSGVVFENEDNAVQHKIQTREHGSDSLSSTGDLKDLQHISAVPLASSKNFSNA